MREILSAESFQRQEDLRKILSVFSGELSKRESRKQLLEEGRSFLANAFGRRDIELSRGSEAILLSAGLLKRVAERLFDTQR